MSVSEKTSQEIDLIKLFHIIWGQRRLIVKWALIGMLVGLIVGLSQPAEFKANAKLLPEENENAMAGMSSMAGLAAMAGINMSSFSQSSGISTDIYPDIVRSTPFLIEMAQIPVVTKKGEASSLYDYIKNDLRSPWWSYIMRAPMAFTRWVFSFGKEKHADGIDEIDPFRLTLPQRKTLDGISKRIGVIIDKKNDLITASAQMQDPFVAAVVCDSLTVKLEEYVARYNTEKAKRDLIFIEELLDDSRERYHKAQKNYANFVDAHQNTILQVVNIEQERLKDELNLTLSVFNQLSQQRESAKIKVQENTPIVTVIEPPSVPLQKAGFGKMTLLILFTILFGAVTIGVITIKHLWGEESKA